MALRCGRGAGARYLVSDAEDASALRGGCTAEAGSGMSAPGVAHLLNGALPGTAAEWLGCGWRGTVAFL